MKVFDQTIREFLNASSSSDPTPGGGSVAALCASLGTSMGSMVAQLSMGPKFDNKRMNYITNQMQAAIQTFEILAQQDMDSFASFMHILKMPKETSKQRIKRSSQLQKAAFQAAAVPLDLMKNCLDVIILLHETADQFNKNVISDLGVAVITLDSAVQSAFLTVKINSVLLKDSGLKDKVMEQGTNLLNDSMNMKQKVIQLVTKKMG
ncbi:cyclodeaminase/cyclohydrolase family protein [Sporolactobacillus sp. CPB3-1]|uniref:Cyclodeaminase/cyclohydrolase family protein n=1 Tax=Sporolactobacillus mangiferae TaxID=2940498 RepID=A0ABT0MBS6_9BACL|nr:cyclodeaminase/cyclohydrolase family protein [Sporolactobacillus mangiferae]